MLIGFRVGNFRSFGEEQTLSFLSRSREADSQRQIHSPSGRCWKLMAVYGPNAGGKSNLIRALAVFKNMVTLSAKETTLGEFLPVEPFELDHRQRSQPTEFEVEFVHQGCRYNYAFAATRQKVVSERLCAFPKGKVQLWFDRVLNENNRFDWTFGRQLKGSKQLWKESTRDNALFLSTAVQLNSEQLKPVAEWMQNRLIILPTAEISKDVTLQLWSSQEEKRADILAFLQKADRTIKSAALRKKASALSHVPESLRQMIESTGGAAATEMRSYHEDDRKERVDFSLDQESTGTQKMFALAAPFLYAAEAGVTLVADELDSHLHPVLFKYLLRWYEKNSLTSQLLFTTHNTTYLSDPKLLEREQVWFVERNPETQTSELYPLSDFQPLKTGGENFEAMYLDGRYGATPVAELGR